MSSRDRILKTIRTNRPELAAEPLIPRFPGDASVDRFKTVLGSIGGQIVEVAEPALVPAVIAGMFPSAVRIASNVVPATVPVDTITPKETLEQVDLAVLRGEFAVAENGAVWVPEKNMIHRALPFIAQHLVLVVPASRLVATMHDAYASITELGGYGVFIAGPSKTADIEQSLVVGAHGARSMTVVLE